MNTLLDRLQAMTVSGLHDYESFIDRYTDEFESYGVEWVQSRSTCRIAWAMVQDLVHHGLPAEHADFHALMSILSMLIEARYSLLEPTETDIEEPMKRLRPLLISGYEQAQERWLLTLNLRQVMNWDRKGYGRYHALIEALRAEIRERFSAEEIKRYDLTMAAGEGASQGFWIG